MLHDDVILDLIPEIDIDVRDALDDELTVNLLLTTFATIETTPHYDVTIDLESMGSEILDPFSPYGKVHRTILFTKSVSGKKQTFGKSSLVINTNINTIGTPDIDPGNHNLISVPISFVKSVAGQTTTFGESSFVITNDIHTAGVNTIGGVNFYGSDLYGEGTYGDMIGYGSGVYGFGIYAGSSILLSIGFGSVISGNRVRKETLVGEVSLESHDIPILRENHKIKIRARTTSGSTGVIKAALYEGSINISGDLVTSSLTNTLADYILNIPNDAASDITDYSNLSIQFWGSDTAGNSLTFEIANIYLELPSETLNVQYGVISRGITFNKSVSGVISSKQTSIAEISLDSHDIPVERINHRIIVRARTTSGSTGVIKAALYEGSNNRSGDLITPELSTTLVDYPLIILNSDAATITDYSNLSIKFWGYDFNGEGLVFEVSKIYLEIPISTGNVTHYGVVSRGITFTKAVSGVVGSKRTTTAEISLASHGIPSSRTNHLIKLRARTTSGSTGVIKAELYEGSTLRSGAAPLTTTSLTNSLANYSLSIPDASAATITSYSNLSIKFWGFDSAGNALVFEISEIYLELPTT